MIIIVSQKKKHLSGHMGALTALWLVSLFLLFYFLRSPSLAAKSARTALDVCATGLIPSLFPFIVLVSVINSSGLSRFAAKAVGAPLEWLFGIPKSATTAVILGALGGFPIGAVCTRELYLGGEITKSEAERLITFTNNASPAFCIGVIGTTFFGDVNFGVRLYICQLVVAAILGIIQRKRISCSPQNIASAKKSLSDTVTSAITDSASAMLKICAFAVFFAVVGDALCFTVEHYFGNVASTLTGAVCELTLGARSSAALDGKISRILCAFAVGWSGISVHMQIASILSDCSIKMRRYYLCKLTQGLLTASLTFIFV